MSVRFSFSYVSPAYMYLLFSTALFHLCISNQNLDDVLCMEGEKQALLQFKHDLIDDGNRLASWVTEEIECCKWAGIACDNSTGHVRRIHLPGLDGRCRFQDYENDKEYREASKRRFRGNLSSSLLHLKQLRHLDISCNDFQGIHVPSFIGSLGNLRYLNLSNSKFGGPIPPQLGNLSELQVLSLGSFHETYNIESTSMSSMEWMSSLRMLHHVDLSSVDLSKATDWFPVINTLPSLAELHMSSCQLSNIHPDVVSLNITSLSLLENIKFSYNFFHCGTKLLKLLKERSNKEISLLDLSFNNFNSFVPQWIFSITSLVSLDLSMYDFKGGFISRSIDNFRNLTYLQMLHVHGNHFMNLLSILNGLSSGIGRNLILLDIGSCDISSPVLDSLYNLTSLLSLDLSGNPLTKPIPKSLGNLCNLRDLDLSFIKSLKISLAYILESFFECKSPALESLFLVRMGLSCHLPDQLGQLINLEHMDLDYNRINGTIPYSLGRLSSLRTLSLIWNQISGPIPFSIGQLSSLEKLDLVGNLLNSSVPDSFDQLSKLERLDFSYNLLTGPIPNSVGKLTSLEWLDLSNNDFTRSLPDSIGRLTSLKMLDLSNNQLDGSLPDSIGQLLFVEVLDISGNSLNGSLPESIGRLTSLKMLDLSHNRFNGILPDSFGQLSKLNRLDFSYNFLTGPVPISTGRLSSLEYLDLSNNLFTGTLPTSLGNLQILRTFFVFNNLLNGSISVQHFSNLLALKTLRAENNKLTLNLGVVNWLPSFQLEVLRLGSWNLGPRFPLWLQSQRNLTDLDISYTGISDFMPSWFWSSFSDIHILNISNNNIQGKFTGSLDEFLCPIRKEPRSLWVLDVANNNLSGVIPDCWLHWKALMILNFENNGFSGEIPQSVGNLSSLQVFKMRNNTLSGNLPASLFNLVSLQIIDLAENEFTGSIPLLIGNEISELKLLSLGSNKMEGEIPEELCRFTSIRVLDLAHNNLSGTLPACFYNFSSMSQKQNLNAFLEVQPSALYGSFQVVVDLKVQVVLLVTKGREHEYSTTLFLVTAMDLSDNRFSGSIPKEFMSLVGLRYMNLSGNNLKGRIPVEIGKMTSLESLDLSTNRLDGAIPRSVSTLTNLNSLNVSFNHLTGEIPTGTQLQSLSESSFIGNTLCGPPLVEPCYKSESSPGEEEQNDAESDLLNWGVVISIVLGFITGFWVVMAPLIVSQVWRRAYFYFLYKVWFKICIAVLSIYETCWN